MAGVGHRLLEDVAKQLMDSSFNACRVALRRAEKIRRLNLSR